MSDASSTKGLRERLAAGTEDKLGRALTDLLENPLLTGAIGRAFDAREKASQAQEVAMGALNLPSAADIERLTRRLRSVSQRLEGIEDQLSTLARTLGDLRENLPEPAARAPKAAPAKAAAPEAAPAKRAPAAARKAAPKRAAARKSS